MKTYKVLRNILAMIAILLSCFTFGQEQKEYINYQGVARDASNEIIANQSIQVGIFLKFGSPTATVLYSENHTTTTDISGVFSLQIGTGTVSTGIYKDLEWGKLAPYATITLNGTDVGTVALQSVPYANASGKAIRMEINDLTNVAGTPTDGQVLKFDGTDWTPATDETGTGSSTLWTENGDDIYYNGGNAGIGTNISGVEPGAGKYLTISPSGATTQNQFPSLELQGQSGTGDPTIGRIDFISNSSPGNSAIARIAARRANSAQFNGDIGFYTKSGLPFSASSLQERMTIKFDGKVGIGTTDPISKFHIKTSDAQSASFESTGMKNYLEFFSNSQYQGYLGLFSGDRDMEFGTATGNTTGKVHLVTNAFPKLTVATNGYVGIGTISPEAKLDLKGGEGNVITREGDFRIGNSTHRLKFGVATDGPEAGRANIRAVGGKNELYLGAGFGLEALRIKENAVELTKELNRPLTGNADLIPIAYGTVSQDGRILNGTGNFRVDRSETIGVFHIIIDYVSYSPVTHTSIVTLQSSTERSFISASSVFVPGGNALAVVTSVLHDNGVPYGRKYLAFSFVVYKQ